MISALRNKNKKENIKRYKNEKELVNNNLEK